MVVWQVYIYHCVWLCLKLYMWTRFVCKCVYVSVSIHQGLSVCLSVLIYRALDSLFSEGKNNPMDNSQENIWRFFLGITTTSHNTSISLLTRQSRLTWVTNPGLSSRNRVSESLHGLVLGQRMRSCYLSGVEEKSVLLQSDSSYVGFVNKGDCWDCSTKIQKTKTYRNGHTSGSWSTQGESLFGISEIQTFQSLFGIIPMMTA